MKRVCNFGPGPAALPLEVLEEVREELLDVGGTGKSILETSHRSPEYSEIHAGTQSLVKELMGLGDQHEVLLLGGGASTQFVMVPMNLLGEGQTADYLVTGSWAKKAMQEAERLGTVRAAANMAQDGVYRRVPRTEDYSCTDGAAYLHLTSNNTITGTQYHEFPKASAPLVADMSSDFMSRPFDMEPFGLVYAGAQKNVGPAGVSVVVIRKDLLQRCRPDLPAMLSYKTHADKGSLYNTPPCFNIYMVGKVLKWIVGQGGLSKMAERNDKKAASVYRVIDGDPDFFRAPVEADSRSQMNIVFRLPNEELEKRFVAEGKQADLIGLKGHRSVGGIRASLYNAIEPAWVESLTQFMREFVRTNG